MLAPQSQFCVNALFLLGCFRALCCSMGIQRNPLRDHWKLFVFCLVVTTWHHAIYHQDLPVMVSFVWILIPMSYVMYRYATVSRAVYQDVWAWLAHCIDCTLFPATNIYVISLSSSQEPPPTTPIKSISNLQKLLVLPKSTRARRLARKPTQQARGGSISPTSSKIRDHWIDILRTG